MRRCPCCVAGGIDPFLLLVCTFLVFPGGAWSQSTPMPSSPAGTNSVAVSGSNYYFFFNGDTLYKYSATNSIVGATFSGIRAKGANGTWFVPSLNGGIAGDFNGVLKYPWDSGLQYARLSAGRRADTITATWRMTYSFSSIDYRYRMHISGRTLVIRVDTVGNTPLGAAEFHLSRCESMTSERASPIRIPYLTLFNLVFCNGSYISFFFDWEVTNCSRYDPPDIAQERYSATSVRFAPTVSYLRKTDGTRNPLQETIYLTVSPDLNGALPNVPGPTAPRAAESMRKIVLSYGPPYPWLLYPTRGYAYRFLDSLKHRRVDSIAVLVGNWSYYGREGGLPDILDNEGNPNPFVTSEENCAPEYGGGRGGKGTLQALQRHVVDTLKYDFSLYLNYVDYYRSSPTFRTRGGYAHAARSPGVILSYVPGWESCSEITLVLKPSQIWNIADSLGSRMQSLYKPNWTYLDVQSAINPSDRVDYDASIGSGAGKFLSTLRHYRALPDLFRRRNPGPVQGEGRNHFLYVGYFDDFEGRLYTADPAVFGKKAPLLVDFDLYKMHRKSAQHGPGHCYEFGYGNTMQRNEVLAYIATELAYGHGGLVSKGNIIDHSVEQAVLEYRHVYPMQRAYASASPIEIKYYDDANVAFESASAYIRRYPGYWDVDSANFMAKVKVTYDNDVIVRVNRSKTSWPVEDIGAGERWFDYHAIVNGRDSLGVGSRPGGTLTLPATNGWLCTAPSIPIL